MEPHDRVRTGIGELDRVLGGGVVRGSLVLVGGDPGIGKSTLLLQAARALAQVTPPVLYVSAEESAAQVKMRADRLGIAADGLLLWTETDLAAVQVQLDDVKPRALVVDSIQTVFLPELESAPGSVAQVRECGARLMMLAKGLGIATFLVGHVTKEGALAGPRVLEHLVDTVLYFEGESHHAYRVLRAVKNRFGSTNEIGVFQMGEGGLAEVTNPSGFFLAERPGDAPGSVVVSSLEGTRPLLLELQALVARASFGTPRRTVLGADYNRVCLLLAVLEKRAGMPLASQDVFVNVAGGGRVTEPAADLGIVLAAASSYLDRPVPGDVVVLGEVGLTGEVRAVAGLDLRRKEAAARGFRRAVVPTSAGRGAYGGAAVVVGRLSDRSAGSARFCPASSGRRGRDKILDTSAVIDGRIADVCGTGCLDGPLVVPGFVLRELQRIADSPDVLKRSRGRRGFEVLGRLQRIPGLRVEIAEVEVVGVEEVDRKLLEFARTREGKVVTNDYNLAKLAEVGGVAVLNVNELANAVKPVMLPGEAMTVQVLREGKEPGQGVGYLDDGTMVVVEQGRRLLGQEVPVVVTSALQTSAGRMVFARPRGDDEARDA